MIITLKSNAKQVRVKLRRYSPPQAAFLRRKVGELIQLGLVRRNNRSQWACAPLLVPKPGPEEFRFTVDLRPVNHQTIPFIWPMPHPETAISDLAGDTCSACIDLFHGYWQMPLDPKSQEFQSFITPDGVFTPTRVLHGQTNATFYFQSTICELCLPIRDNLLQWLDDLLFIARLRENYSKIFASSSESAVKTESSSTPLSVVFSQNREMVRAPHLGEWDQNGPQATAAAP